MHTRGMRPRFIAGKVARTQSDRTNPFLPGPYQNHIAIVTTNGRCHTAYELTICLRWLFSLS